MDKKGLEKEAIIP